MPDVSGNLFPDLDTPQVLVDVERLERNIARMAAIARRVGAKLRPHTKTHKSPAIARLQVAAGAAGITVAKLGEAEVMANAGFTDILIAYPILGPLKLARLEQLCRRARVTILLDSVEAAEAAGAVGRRLGRPVDVYLDVDTGLGRMGPPAGAEAVALGRAIAAVEGVRLVGVASHAGHAYAAKDRAELEAIARADAEAVAATAARLRAAGIPVQEVSVGATPTAALTPADLGVTEMRPGAYVFNDRTQLAVGACGEDDCALSILTTVVSRPRSDRVIVDAGTKTMAADAAQLPGFGHVLGQPSWVVERLTEEHGILRVPPDAPIRIGDRLRLIPNHVCPVVNLADVLYGVRGDRVETVFTVEGRGKTR